MTVTVSTVQRATLKFDRNATVLDLLQALSENLGGEWDHATLSVTTGIMDHWTLVATMDTGEEPARLERWETDDGEHGAVEEYLVEGEPPMRVCSCGVRGTDEQMAEHLKLMSDG